MDIFGSLDECRGEDPTDISNGQKDTIVQLVIALGLGLSTFIGFCILRPRWKSLYAARKQQKNGAAALPELPDTFFGWVPALWRVTEQQVLASAGLDAFVFLSFFKMAIKFLSVTLLLAAIIIAPINNHFVGLFENDDSDNVGNSTMIDNGDKGHRVEKDKTYLWAYLIFTYVFTAIALYFMWDGTKRVIEVRQDYLGSQSTITDRTVKLSGIPKDLRSEHKIKDIIEGLEVGEVESVTLCRDWKELDSLLDDRASVLRKLEECWAVHLGKTNNRGLKLPAIAPLSNNNDEGEDEHDREDDNLLSGYGNGSNVEKPRPTTRVWFGTLKLQSKKVDAIDYYEERLRKLDEKIHEARKKDFTPTPLAFVTLDSVAACQMAVQALLDPSPLQLLAELAPAPSDVVWRNTYLSRSRRMLMSWSIAIFVTILTIIWLIPVATLASLLNLCTIEKVWPRFARLLSRHDIAQALVQTGLPTLVVSLLNVAVPYLYDYLSNMQGSISQSQVELSVISKNFSFTFFNVFLVFTVFGAATNILPMLRASFKDTTRIATELANSLKKLGIFYTNFILLQGVGLFPLRLLEFGSVFLYPISRMGAKTPRDFAELVQPPVFSYGFYLPTAILIFILCIVYSILPPGFLLLLFGLIYFVLGYFTYKYQLLYAMDHPQHATGQAWSMIMYRVLIGLGIFQLAMAGVIALKQAFTPAALVVPLLPFTVWVSYFYGRTYEPLTKFIALRSIRREDDPDVNIADEDVGLDRPRGHIRRDSTTIDEDRERGQKFVNPSLIVPLEKIWTKGNTDAEQSHLSHEDSVASSTSFGEGNVWRDNGDQNV
ncbi:MAG: hypothetical protein M1818_001223 [Claussenomyces sp. TS43310]|nr:MAG: hypothetical protein M1818_001223 [Claussenomyces sp. TS43310]